MDFIGGIAHKRVCMFLPYSAVQAEVSGELLLRPGR